MSKNFIRFDFNEIITKSLVKQKLTKEDYNYIENCILSNRMSPIEKIRQAISQNLGYKYIEVTEEKNSYIVSYKGEFIKIIAIQKSQYETDNFQDTINKIINEIMR